MHSETAIQWVATHRDGAQREYDIWVAAELMQTVLMGIVTYSLSNFIATKSI